MNEIEFAEVTNEEGGMYLEVWKDDKHFSFFVEDVLRNMNRDAKIGGFEMTRTDYIKAILAMVAILVISWWLR
jgi:hypothetical protein